MTRNVFPSKISKKQMCWLLNYIITRDLFNDIHYDWIFQKSCTIERLYLWLIYIHAILTEQGWKTKSKFKEVLQMSYLKPSCNCKFCQLWEKVFLFIIAKHKPHSQFKWRIIHSSLERCAKTTFHKKQKIRAKKKLLPKTFSIQDRKNI